MGTIIEIFLSMQYHKSPSYGLKWQGLKVVKKYIQPCNKIRQPGGESPPWLQQFRRPAFNNLTARFSNALFLLTR